MVNSPVSTGAGAAQVLLDGRAANPIFCEDEDEAIDDCIELVATAAGELTTLAMLVPTLDVELVPDEEPPQAVNKTHTYEKTLNRLIAIFLSSAICKLGNHYCVRR